MMQTCACHSPSPLLSVPVLRSPDAAITLLVKQVLSVHRLVLTGSPIQNSLTELWSIFDFIFPGKLGTLPIFEDEFAFPILNGGYTSATPVQIQLAYKCALILRDLINPYILRRTKADVAQHLPPKTEQVLFCNLTPKQHDCYRKFLDAHAKDISEIMDGKTSLFRVIHYLRKISNHPDLLQLKVKQSANARRRAARDDDDGVNDDSELTESSPDYGSVERSGKMKVVQQVLRMWHEQGHRCLIFSQTRQMLDILEKFVRAAGYNYRRVDGATSIKQRLPLIDEFNHDSRIFIMLLTTRAGGLGVNLTGADRVILYDPDWNPSTDGQARERAYRIGQQRSVTVYRLITRGCIEEKVYHRQIWKQFLTDKVLRDPKQKRFFSNQDIKDLFTLAPLAHAATSAKKRAHNETADIFKGAGGEIDKEQIVAQEREREYQQFLATQRQKMEAERLAAVNAAPVDLEEGEIPPEEPPASAPLDAAAAAGPLPPPSAAPPPSRGQVDLDSDPALDLAAYDSGSDDPPADPSKSASDDNRILAALFSREGIQSAMDHDAILGASSQQEKAVIAGLAAKVAERAVQALKKSRQAMRDAPVNAPTWTGRSGVTGAPPGMADSAPRPRFGTTTRRPVASFTPSSSPTDESLASARLRPPSFEDRTSSVTAEESKHFDSTVSGFALTAPTAAAAAGRIGIGGGGGSAGLLARMRARNQVSSAMASHTGVSDDALVRMQEGAAASSSPTSTAALDKPSQLASSLRSTLLSHPGGLTSAELVSLFSSQIGALESDKLVFRQLLRSVAVLVGKKTSADRTNGNNGTTPRWQIKDEFR